jgi:hypothetical protein
MDDTRHVLLAQLTHGSRDRWSHRKQAELLRADPRR